MFEVRDIRDRMKNELNNLDFNFLYFNNIFSELSILYHKLIYSFSMHLKQTIYIK